MTVPEPSLTLRRADRVHLRGGAADLGVALDDEALDRFAAYAETLARWRESANLISYRNGAELVERHLLDSLACAWLCGAARDVADLGSGAGLPGVPLAIVDPSRRVVLIEPRRRRASFLRQVRRDLRLERLEVLEMRAEEFTEAADSGPVDVAITRAVWRDDADLRYAVPWLRPGGILLSMRADIRHAMPPTIHDLATEPSLTYRVGRGPRRRIDVFRRTRP
ncbi:MAG TPA: 16S rRNA (guanine(527)-N(7))-methyltransferase RsmG [Candidatus Binatia bacterium]